MRFINTIIVLGAAVYVTACSAAIYRGNAKVSPVAYDTATYNYVYGEALRQKLLGNAGDALKYFEQCIRMNPASDAASYQIAQISVQRGDFVNGKSFAQRAYKLDTHNLWYITLMGDIYYQEKNIDSAVVYYEKAVNEFPDKDELKINLGALLSQNSDFSRAAEIYNLLEKKYGTGSNATALAVKNLVNAGKINEAEEKVMTVLKNSPDNIQFNGMLAEIYQDKGEREKAEKTYTKLLSIDSTNIQTVLSVISFLLEGKEYDKFFRLLNDIVIDNKFTRDGFMTIFEKVMEYPDVIKNRNIQLEVIMRVLENNYNNDSLIIMLRPELYQKEGKPDLAAARLEELIVRYPDNYMIWERLLLIYSDLKDYDRLYVLGKECATKFNMSYVAKVLYASAAMEKKDYNIALEELEKAKILAGNQDDMIAQVQSMEADVYYRRKEYLKSFELYKSILKKNPEDVIVLNNYAYFLAEQNQDLKEAERMIRIVMDKEKSNGTYVDTYAWVLYKRGKFKEAAKVMEDMMSSDTTQDSEWFEHYGYIMKALKQYDTAVAYWKKALKLDGEKEYLNEEIKSCSK